MGNREINYPDILPQKRPPTHLSLPCNSRVKIDVNVYNNITRNDINSWKVIQASSAHLSHKHLWDGKLPSDQYPYGTWEQNSKTSLLANFQIAAKTRWQNSVQWFSDFLYYDSWRNAWKTFCIRIGHVIRRSGIKCCLSKWRHRIKRQSKITIILLANNIVAINH